MNKEELKSDCCKEPIDMITTTDGSNPLRCRKCKKPCGIYNNDKEDNWKK
jgi:hypothetical protein